MIFARPVTAGPDVNGLKDRGLLKVVYTCLYKFRRSSIQEERICFKYLVGISPKKEKKKEKKAHSKLNKCRSRSEESW